MDFRFWIFELLDFWNFEFGFSILDFGEPAQIGRGNRPATAGEPAGGVGGTARPRNPKAFLYRESKNPFRQAWLGNKLKNWLNDDGNGDGLHSPEATQTVTKLG